MTPIASTRADDHHATDATTSTANANLHTREDKVTAPIASARAHVGTADAMAPTSRLDAAILRSQAKAALIGLRWKPAIAHAATAAAATAQGTEMTLERLIFECYGDVLFRGYEPDELGAATWGRWRAMRALSSLQTSSK